MKRLYISPIILVLDDDMSESVVCTSKEFVTTPQSGNGGNAQGSTSMSSGGSGDGSDMNGVKILLSTGFEDDF